MARRMLMNRATPRTLANRARGPDRQQPTGICLGCQGSSPSRRRSGLVIQAWRAVG